MIHPNSIEAKQKLTESEIQRRAIEVELKSNFVLTRQELSHKTGYDINVICPRCNELLKQNRIIEDGNDVVNGRKRAFLRIRHESDPLNVYDATNKERIKWLLDHSLTQMKAKYYEKFGR